MRRYLVLFVILVANYLAYDEFREYLQKVKGKAPTKSVNAAVSALTDLGRETASVPPSSKGSLTAMEVADRYLEAHRETWRLQPYHEFRPVEFKTPLGTKIKYSAFQDGIPILNMGISIQLERDLSIGRVENSYEPIERVAPTQKEMKVLQLAAKVKDRYEVVDDPLSFTPPVLILLSGTKIPTIAYQLSVRDKARNGSSAEILVRASDGQVLGRTHPRSEF